MSKLKNPLLSLQASGSVGRVLTFLRRNKVDLVERMPVVPDANSPAQQYHRNMFGLCVDLWHTLSEAEKRAWESAGTARHMTGYAWYISQCLRPNPGIYLPLAGGTMAGAIEMATFAITGLPAPAGANDAVRQAYVDASSTPAREGARVYKSGSQSIPNNTHTILSFDQERWDTDTIHDNAVNNSRLTAKTAGLYLINAQVGFGTNVVGYRGISFFIDNVDVPIRVFQNPNATDWHAMQATTLWEMAVNSYAEVAAYQSSGGPLDVINSPQAVTEFMMQRIG